MARTPQSPGPVTDDTFTGPRPRPIIEKGPFAERIEHYLTVLYASGDDAEEEHARALNELRRDAPEAVIALAKAEAGCQRNDYPRRWALVYAATRLEHDAALPYFRELVLTPIPAPKTKDAHAFNVAKEETILRTTAIDGIGRLARKGNRRALDTMFDFLDIPSISVCRATIQALLAADPGSRERIAERVPRNFRYLLDVRTTSVTSVPQVKDARKHLKKGKVPAKPAPPDPQGGQPDKPSKRTSPKLGRK